MATAAGRWSATLSLFRRAGGQFRPVAGNLDRQLVPGGLAVILHNSRVSRPVAAPDTIVNSNVTAQQDAQGALGPPAQPSGPQVPEERAQQPCIGTTSGESVRTVPDVLEIRMMRPEKRR
jgi:hypothetical protein